MKNDARAKCFLCGVYFTPNAFEGGLPRSPDNNLNIITSVTFMFTRMSRVKSAAWCVWGRFSSWVQCQTFSISDHFVYQLECMLVATNKTFDPTALWQATGERETVAAKGAVAPGSEKKKDRGRFDFGCRLGWEIGFWRFQGGTSRTKVERDVQDFVFQARVTIYVLNASILGNITWVWKSSKEFRKRCALV